MTKINENFLKLQAGYLFPEIGRRRRAFQKANPDADIISMGIGDVTQPLAGAVVEAMKAGPSLSWAELALRFIWLGLVSVSLGFLRGEWSVLQCDECSYYFIR